MADDETLFRHMDEAMARGYPEVLERKPAHSDVIAIVASGPSVAGQLETIRAMQGIGTKIVAIKDAHDWLLSKGIVPDYALAIDPQESRSRCFKVPHQSVNYMIGSQCHPAMFDHLKGMTVTLWHLYIKQGQKRPLNRMLIGGGTTSGLRAISLFYILGCRHFALFGFDSSVSGDVLRVNGDGLKSTDSLKEVRITPGGETFYTNSAMALQAQHFQDYYTWMPDGHFYPFGHGLLQAIIKMRDSNALALACAAETTEAANGRVSFIHAGDSSFASWRYRADIPARGLSATLNDHTAGTLIFTKPRADELMQMALAKARGAWVVADFCDDHFEWPHYQEALRVADAVTCPTEEMARLIALRGRVASVVPDPFEYPLCAPHCAGTRLLWYGSKVNGSSLHRILPELEGYELAVVSNLEGAIPWSRETMLRQFAIADIVVIPATAAYKSANRAIEAIRQGCFVVAEPHPAISGIPGVWLGNIKEGVEWAKSNQKQARLNTLKAQAFVRKKYSPLICTRAWRKAIRRPTT